MNEPSKQISAFDDLPKMFNVPTGKKIFITPPPPPPPHTKTWKTQTHIQFIKTVLIWQSKEIHWFPNIRYYGGCTLKVNRALINAQAINSSGLIDFNIWIHYITSDACLAVYSYKFSTLSLATIQQYGFIRLVFNCQLLMILHLKIGWLTIKMTNVCDCWANESPIQLSDKTKS